MNLKKWAYLFITTLLIGGFSAILVGMMLEGNSLWGSGMANLFIGLLWSFGLGATFSIVSQMGFFAYLTIHNVGMGVFKRIWPYVQVLLILFTFFDLIYLRYTTFGKEAGDGLLGYIVLPLVILLYSCFIAFLKVNQTNIRAAIPTVFVLFVVTIIEWIPALKENNFSSMIYMLVPLLLCNTWQIMQLHRLTQSKAGAQS
ncbi:hypothetical protein BEP19_10425 [Ammoniphilus oxalaticus]|uniref:KinB signaling pathway activation protein n=1 Tax=Ammoniphilus oxalaticus TaxID=66863 RepID=A0A419SFU7_9BACL|nr:KinB-signaling pathway activation protein [Ammoniphilus oxalaticus]RKD22663.1 hypothetical protein BEP19_10425 [Ammoniphilus oxalaticus]